MCLGVLVCNFRIDKWAYFSYFASSWKILFIYCWVGQSIFIKFKNTINLQSLRDYMCEWMSIDDSVLWWGVRKETSESDLQKYCQKN